AADYLGGQGTTSGGVLVDGGNFPWADFPDRQPLLTQPDSSYHGAVWPEVVQSWGPIAFVFRARVRLLRDFGAPLTPLAAFQLLQGLETL
ncbi:bifunctional O-acetylhomoserine aminocarboxypropyltransferase/cysteine synthase, partial [Acinetobacter baumannii]